MQRIERYGVIALVFLLVTILAVALWGQRKNQSLMSFLKRGQKSETPLSATPGATGETPIGVPLADGSTPNRELALTTPPVDPAVGGPSVPSGLAGDPTAPTVDPRLALAPPAGPSGQVVTFAGSPQEAVAPGATPPLPSGFVPDTLAGSAPMNTVATGGASGLREYKVKRGDTLGAIARREMGSSQRWQEIAALNGGIDPQRVREGMLLKLPAGSGKVAKPSSAAPAAKSKPAAAAAAKTPMTSGTAGESYTIRSGDTLGEIARRTLGSSGRWREIAALNPSLDPSRLSVGTKLRLPATKRETPRAKDSDVELASASPKKARVR
jgi:nucleoid-associated protein YgaU